MSRFARSSATPSLVRLLSSETRAKIENAVKEDPLVVFMKGSPSMPQCGVSRAVLQILQVQGVNPDKVATYNCLEDQELRDGIKEFSDWPTIPQVYVNGEFVGGCDIMLNSMSCLTHRQCTKPVSSKACYVRQVFLSSQRPRSHSPKSLSLDRVESLATYNAIQWLHELPRATQHHLVALLLSHLTALLPHSSFFFERCDCFI